MTSPAGLSARNPWQTAQRMIAPIRCLRVLASTGFSCQIGTKTAMTSAVVLLSTGLAPNVGNA